MLKSSTLPRPLFVAVILLITALIVTWPLIFHLTDAVSLGTEQESTVPFFNIWTLWWIADRTEQGFENFWQAPIFYPSEGVFTFSEPQPFTGVLVFGFWKVFDSPMAVYNTAILLCLFLNGVFTYRLGRALHIPPVPAMLGGILMVGLPVCQKLLGVLPLIPLFGILWALEGFIRFGRNGSLHMAIWAGAGLLVQLFTSQQLGLLFGLFVLPAGLLALFRQQFTSSSIIKLGSVGVAVLLFTGWYLWYPLQLHQALAFTRSDQLVAALSARPSDYLSKPLSASIAFPPKEDRSTDTGGLFPGFGLLLFAAWGAMNGVRQAEIRPWIWFLVGMACCAFILSLGTHSPLDGGTTFRFLRQWIPGFHELRSPFRFAILVQLSLVLLSLQGLATLGQLLWSHGRLAVCLVGMAAFAENLSVPQPLAALTKPFPSPWAVWMHSHGHRHVLAHIPFPAGLHVSDYQMETERMLAQIIHQNPLINGYSGYFPPGYDQFQLDMAKNFPSSFLLCFLTNDLQADTLVIDIRWYNEHQEQMAHFMELSEIVYSDQNVVIMPLHQISGNCAAK